MMHWRSYFCLSHFLSLALFPYILPSTVTENEFFCSLSKHIDGRTHSWSTSAVWQCHILTVKNYIKTSFICFNPAWEVVQLKLVFLKSRNPYHLIVALVRKFDISKMWCVTVQPGLCLIPLHFWDYPVRFENVLNKPKIGRMYETVY